MLEQLNVDGVGMGIEISSDSFKNNHLDRFCDTQAIKLAFKLLKEKNIKRTSYNVIGFPNQTEDDIKSTINFNAELNPDNITVAFYSPYIGTMLVIKDLIKNNSNISKDMLMVNFLQHN